VPEIASLTLLARPPKYPRLRARLSLWATPQRLNAVEDEWLRAWPPKYPRARESLLLMATPPTVAAMLSLVETARPPK